MIITLFLASFIGSKGRGLKSSQMNLKKFCPFLNNLIPKILECDGTHLTNEKNSLSRFIEVDSKAC